MCKHEPCLYYHPDYKNNEIYFIRQVDDFAIGCPDKKIAEEIIDIIDSYMTIKIKHLGVITRFNGVDITQTRNILISATIHILIKFSRINTSQSNLQMHTPFQ